EGAAGRGRADGEGEEAIAEGGAARHSFCIRGHRTLSSRPSRRRDGPWLLVQMVLVQEGGARRLAAVHGTARHPLSHPVDDPRATGAASAAPGREEVWVSAARASPAGRGA